MAMASEGTAATALAYLADAREPATSAELVAAAVRANAPHELVSALAGLPDRRWSSAADAVAALDTEWDRPSGSGRIVDPLDDMYD